MGRIYDTREEFIEEVKKLNIPAYMNLTDDEIFEDYLAHNPEYKDRIKPTNTPTAEPPDLDLEDKEDAPNKKTFFTAMAESFSKDGYKYIPFVRDAELVETARMLGRANRVKDGTASEEDILKVKEFSLDASRPTTFGYKIVDTLRESTAFFLETLGSIFVAGATFGVGAPLVGKTVAGQATKFGTKKAVLKSINTALKNRGLSPVEKEVLKKAAKEAGTKSKISVAALDLADRVAKRQFSRDIIKTAQLAKAGLLKDVIKKEGVGNTLKKTSKSLGGGVAETFTALNLFRTPNAVKDALERMSPVFITEQGDIDEEILLRLVDDGDDFLPALAKAYATQGIEFFSESVGASLYTMHYLMKGDVFANKIRKGLTKAAKRSGLTKAGQEAIEKIYVNTGLKAAITPYLEKQLGRDKVKELLFKTGFDGTIAEMYEERVGDVLRASVGLQPNFLPTPEQLALEAVSFTIFGAGMSAATNAAQTKFLGGAGYEQAQKAQDLIKLRANNPDAVLLENEETKELSDYIDEYVDLAIEQADNPSLLTKILKGAKINNFGLFDKYEQRGSISEALTMLNIDSTTARIEAMRAEGKSTQEIKADIKTHFTEVVKAQGVIETNTEIQRKRVQDLIKKGEANFVRDSNGRGFYVVDINKTVARYEENQMGQQVGKVIEALKQDRTTLIISPTTYSKLQASGAIEGTSITHVLNSKNTASIGEIMQLLNMSTPAEAKQVFEALETLDKHTNKSNVPIEIEVKMLPNYEVVGTVREFNEQFGYNLEGSPESTKRLFIAGRNYIDQSNPNKIIVEIAPSSDLSAVFEEVIEGVFKSLDVQEGSNKTYQMLKAPLLRAAKEQGINVRKEGDQEGWSEIEVLSKVFQAAIMNQYAGAGSEQYSKVVVPQKIQDIVLDEFTRLLGKKTIDLMMNQSPSVKEKKPSVKKAEIASETPEQEETKEEVPEEPKLTTKEKLANIPKDQPVAPEAVEEIISEAEARVQALKGPEAVEAQAVLFQLNKALNAAKRDNPEDVAPFITAAFDILNNSDVSFRLEESSTEDSMLEAQIDYIEYLHAERLVSYIDNTAILKEINKLLTQSSPGLMHLYDILKENPTTREFLKTLRDRQFSFIKFLEETNEIADLRVLHKALNNVLANNKNVDPLLAAERLHESFVKIFNRYENLEKIPVYEYNERTRNGRTYKELNLKNGAFNEQRLHKQIREQMALFLRQSSIQDLRKRHNAFISESGHINHEDMVSFFSTLTAIPGAIFNRFNPKLLSKFYIDFEKAINIAEKRDNRADAALALTSYFFKETNGIDYDNTLAQFILQFNQGQLDIAIKYRNSDGEQELALRSTSQLIDVRNALNTKMGQLSGRGLDNKKKGAKKFTEQERIETLRSMFIDALERNRDVYWQSSGQMGQKNQIYIFEMPLLKTRETINEAIKEYEEYYNSLSDHGKQFLVPPSVARKLQQLSKGYDNKNIQNKPEISRFLFELNYILNKGKIDQQMHGNFESYKDYFDMNKRTSQVPTPGLSFKSKKEIKYIVIDDSKLLDGQAFMSSSFAKEFAQYYGADYMLGAEEATSVKPVVSFVDKNSNRILLKGNIINSSLSKDVSPEYKKIAEFLEQNPQIDLVIPLSMAKSGWVRGDKKLKELSTYENPVIESITGDQFIAVQNLDYSNTPSIRNQSKQQITDTLHGLHQEQIYKLVNENIDILTGMFNNQTYQESVKASEVLDEIIKERGDTTQISEPAAKVIEDIVKQLRNNNDYEGTEQQLALEMIEVLRDVISSHSWHKETDADYFSSVFKALNNQVTEIDPQIYKVVQQIKARFLMRAMRRQLPRVMMQKISAYDLKIPSFKVVNGKTRLPWIISNTEGARTARGFKSKRAAIEHIKKNYLEFMDMFEVDSNGVLQNGQNGTKAIVREYEIYTVAELKEEYDIDEFGDNAVVVPGEIIIESRIPGENLQSHIPHRLWKHVNKELNGNFSITPMDVVLAKDEDFDGDIGYQYLLDKNETNIITRNRNLQILLMADTYTNPSYLPVIQQQAQDFMKQLDEIRPKMNNEERIEKEIYSNSYQGEAYSNKANSTALDALGRTASYIKFYDVAQHLKFRLKSNSGISNNFSFYGGVPVRYEPSDGSIEENIKLLQRKYYYATTIINLTVDNISNQQMEKLSLNEITTSMLQALLFLQTDINSKNIKERVQKIVEFLETNTVQAYVNARRTIESLEFDKGKDTRINTIRNLMIRELKSKDAPTTQVEKVLKLDEVIQEIGTISQLLDTQHEVPKSISEIMQKDNALKSLEDNSFKIFDTSGSKINKTTWHPVMRPVAVTLIQMKDKAYKQNIMLSDNGKKLLDKVATKHRVNTTTVRDYYIDHMEDTILRALSNRAVTQTDKPNYIQEMGYLISLIQQFEASNPGNLFLQMLEETSDSKGDISRIQILSALQNAAVPESLINYAQEAFSQLPQELQDALVRHQVMVYGLSDVTYAGGFLPLISRTARRKLSQDVSKEIESFNDNSIDDSFVDVLNDIIVERYAEKQTLRKKTSVWFQAEKTNFENSHILHKSLLEGNTDWINNIPSEFFGKEFDREEFFEYLSEIIKEQKTTLKEIGNPNNVTIRSNNDVGSESYALYEYSKAITYLSPLMFGGARGMHKQFITLLNDSRTDADLAKLMQEVWEKSVGARKELGKGARPITEDNMYHGNLVLAAIHAKITGTEKVVQSIQDIEVSLEKALEIEINRLKKRLGNRWNEPEFSSSRRQEAIKVLESVRDTANIKKITTIGDSLSLIILGRLNEYKEKTGKELIPMTTATYSKKSATQIYKDYMLQKSDWMEKPEVIEEAIRNSFEQLRNKFNKQRSAYLTEIPFRKNYMPLFYKQDQYKKELRELNNEDVNHGGTVRSLGRTSDINTLEDMLEQGYTPLFSNPAAAYERYARETSKDRYMSSVWQAMLMSQLPDGTQPVVPLFNSIELFEKKGIVSGQFIAAYAKQLENGNGISRNRGESDIAFITRVAESLEDYIEYDTGIPSMPKVYVQRGDVNNVIKMIINKRAEGKLLNAYESVLAWTKFAAIGIPYLSWFHHLALVESRMVAFGVKQSDVWNPAGRWKEFNAFRKNLSQDPYIAAKWYKTGMQATLQDPDYRQGLVNENIQASIEWANKRRFGGMAKSLDRFLEMKMNWDTKLWVQLHAPLKIWTAEGFLHKYKQIAMDRNMPFDEQKAITEIGEYVDQLYGGINFQRHLWATPIALQTANNVSFAFDWTYSALGMAGAGQIPGLDYIFGSNSDMQKEMRRNYWMGFVPLVMFGIPNALQFAIYALTRPFGENDDEPFSYLNEHGRASYIDVTPLYRLMPFYDSKQYGGPNEQRRVYLRWGKQGWEIKDWATNPIRTGGYKLSIPVKQAIEQISGRSMGGWDLAFKDESSYYGVLEAQGSFLKGRVGHFLKMFAPFSVQDIINKNSTPLPNIPVTFAKMKKGKHGWYASKQLGELYVGYIKNFDKLYNHRANVERIGSDIVAAAAKNGFDPDKVQRAGLAMARAELYGKLENALRKKRFEEADKWAVRLRGLEGAAYSINKTWREITSE